MIEDEVILTVDYLLQDYKEEEKFIHDNASRATVNVRATQSKGSSLENSMVEVLCSALLGTRSQFEISPKLELIKVAIGLAAGKDPDKFAKECGVPVPSAKEIATMQQFSQSLAALKCTDDDILTDTPATPELGFINTCIQGILGIPLVKALHNILIKCYKEALRRSTGLVDYYNSGVQQEEEIYGETLADIRESTDILNSTKEDQPVVFMESLSYPLSEYTCGNPDCGKRNDASNLFYAKSYCAPKSVYTDMLKRCLESTVRIADAMKVHAPLPTVQELHPGMINSSSNELVRLSYCSGIFRPHICPHCGQVNIPSLRFIFLYRACVIQLWSRTPPAITNNDTRFEFDAGIVDSGLKEILQEAGAVDNLLRTLNPAIVNTAIEDTPIEYSVTDLFSRETYDYYLTSLKNSSRKPCPPEQLRTSVLAYLLSSLHLTKVGYTPRDYVYSVLKLPAMVDYSARLREIVGEFKQCYADTIKYDIMARMLSSGSMGKPFTHYSDILLSTDYIAEILTSLHDNDFKQRMDRGEVSLAEVTECKTLAESRACKLLDETEELCKGIAAKLLEMENTYFGTDAENFSSLVPQPNEASADLILTSSSGQDTAFFASGFGDLVYNHIAGGFDLALLQTIMHYADNFTARQNLFNKAMQGNAYVKKMTDLAKKIKCLQLYKPTDSSVDSCFRAMMCAIFSSTLDTTTLQKLGISVASVYMISLENMPTIHECISIINESVCGMLDFPVNVLKFKECSLADYIEKIKQYSSEDISGDVTDEDAAPIEGADAAAIAEAAAEFYVRFINTDGDTERLKAELRKECDAAKSCASQGD